MGRREAVPGGADGGGYRAELDPRAQGFLSQGEAALADGNLDSSQENFDKASALAEADPHVLLDQARLAAAQADIPWLKLRLLPADATDEVRMTKAELDERIGRGRRAADAALFIAPLDLATIRVKMDSLRLSGERDAARGYVSKIIGQSSQPETAYVLAALDLAEPDSLWTTVIERLRFAAAGEGNAGRARAALVYALAKSGDVMGAKGELAKLDAMARPYPLLPNLRSFVDGIKPKAATPDAGPMARAGGRGEGAQSAQPSASVVGGPWGWRRRGAGTSGPAANGAGEAGPIPLADHARPADSRSGMRGGFRQAIRKGGLGEGASRYQEIVSQNPSDSEALCGLGDVARARGDNEGAIAFYRRAIGVNPSYLPALLGVADTQAG